MNHSDNQGNTPLHVGAGVLSAKGVTILLGAGAAKKAKNEAGQTPVQVARLTKKSMQAFIPIGECVICNLLSSKINLPWYNIVSFHADLPDGDLTIQLLK